MESAVMNLEGMGDGGISEEVGGQGQDRVDISAGGVIYQGCGDDRAAVGFEEGFAQGTRFGDEDADLLHQSSGQGAEQVAVGGVGASEEAALQTGQSCA